jgi:hypothetical protein
LRYSIRLRHEYAWAQKDRSRVLFGTYAEVPSWEPENRRRWDLLLPHAETLRSHFAEQGESSETGLLWKIVLLIGIAEITEAPFLHIATL